MRDIFIDGLPIVDRLEIAASTSEVAALAHCDQSKVSRMYRHVSDELGLDFAKRDGIYQARTNLELLATLRRAAQLMRLDRGAAQLQWTGHPWNGQALAAITLAPPLPRHWLGEQRTLDLLQSRVLDLAVINGLDVLPPGWGDGRTPFEVGDWMAVGLVRYAVEISSHPLHPLHAKTQLRAKDLARFPMAPAAAATFPVLSAAMTRLGLWPNHRNGHAAMHPYQSQIWEELTADGWHWVPTSPISRHGLEGRVQLKPLAFETGIHDMDVVLVLREHVHHASVQQLIEQIRWNYRQRYGALAGLDWL